MARPIKEVPYLHGNETEEPFKHSVADPMPQYGLMSQPIPASFIPNSDARKYTRQELADKVLAAEQRIASGVYLTEDEVLSQMERELAAFL